MQPLYIGRNELFKTWKIVEVNQTRIDPQVGHPAGSLLRSSIQPLECRIEIFKRGMNHSVLIRNQPPPPPQLPQFVDDPDSRPAIPGPPQPVTEPRQHDRIVL